MKLSRRSFTTGAFAFAAGSQLASLALAQTSPALSDAIDAIRRYGDAHTSYYGLPGLTLGVTTAGGFATTLNFGFANADARTAITPDTLFQIGSISKSMTAVVIHQLAAEGRLHLTDTISALLPRVPLPTGNLITIQHLLDHGSGLADGPAPIFQEGGLVQGFRPGEHWAYSNIGYSILGKLAEQILGKPLDQLLTERIFAPLGMRRSRGAIIAADRLLYAQAYGPADDTIPFARGLPLAPASWVDVTGGEGCVASTASDMILFLRSLVAATRGSAGLGLPPALAEAFTMHAVPSDTPDMRYGNGLMHVAHNGRSYLHHTGGMIGFTSSFHLDVASGVGAFASSSLGAAAEYRPRLLTQFAVEAIGNAVSGRPAPTEPMFDPPLRNAISYVGRYSGPFGSFEVRAGAPLTIVAGGQSAALQPWGGDIFRTTHPLFRRFTLMFERQAGAVIGASWGSASFARGGSSMRLPASDPQVARFAGRYVDDNPWWGAAIVVERGGKLWLGTDTPMERLGENLWRIGHERWSPERATFSNFIDGRPQTMIYSGERFDRHDV